MRRLRAGQLAAALLAAGSSFGLQSWAGMQNADCREPFVYEHAAVNAVILPYDYADTDRPLSVTARQLAMLIQLDTLFSIVKYGGIGAVHTVVPPRSGVDCSAGTVTAKLVGALPGAAARIREGNGLVILWGHLYEEGDEILVQSYVRFLRRGMEEDLRSAVEGVEFAGRLPARAFAFPRNHLTARDLASIQREFDRAMVVRKRPDPLAPPVRLPGGADLSRASFAYSILETSGDWVRIRSFTGDVDGWLRAGMGEGRWPLRRVMPELHFVEALVGYLRARQGVARGDSIPPQTTRWVEEAVKRYEEGTALRREPLPSAVGKALLGILRMERSGAGRGDVVGAHAAFAEAARLIPYDAEARNLEMMGRIGLTWGGSPDTVRPFIRSLGRPVLKATSDDLTAAIALDPGNARILANLEGFYNLARRRKPVDLTDADLGLTSQEITTRLGKVEKVRALKRPPAPP